MQAPAPFPEDEPTAAPLNRALFVGWVEELADDTATIHLWESPGGQEGYTTLDLTHFEETPQVGDRVFIWTWDEIEGGPDDTSGSVKSNISIIVERRELSEGDIQQLNALAERIERAVLSDERESEEP